MKSPMDLSKFKKVKSDAKCSTFRHEDGHEFKIAHAALSPKLKKQLEDVPHYKDGGKVEPKEDEDGSFSKDVGSAVDSVKNVWNDYAPEDKTQSGADFASRNNVKEEPLPAPAVEAPPDVAPAREPASNVAPAPQSIAPAAEATAPQATIAPAAQPAAPAPAQSGSGAAGLTGAMNQYASGINQEAQAIGAQGKAEAAIQEEHINKQKELIKSYQENSKHAMEQIEAATEDYKKQYINKDHYMESRTSGQKVMSAIGLLLSGFGSGLSGQENMASKFIDQQIDRDIKAQEQNMGKTENLLNFNYKKYGNMKDATEMTYAMQKNLYATEIEQAASRAKDPIAKALGMQKAAKMRADMIPNIDKFAQNQALQKMMSSGAKTEDEFKKNLNAVASLSPEKHKELMDMYIPGVGIASRKPTDADLDQLSSLKQMNEMLTQLQRRAVEHGTTIPGSTADRENKALLSSIKLKAKDANKLGALSGSDMELMDGISPNPGSWNTGAVVKQIEVAKGANKRAESAAHSKLGVTPFQSGKVRVSNGKQTLEIDPKDIGHAKKDGYERVQ